MKNQKINQNGKAEKMMVLVKTFDHYHHKFQLFQPSCKIVKEFWNWNLDQTLITTLLSMPIRTVQFEKLYTILK